MKLILIALLALTARAEDVFNSTYVTYTGSQLYYCELVPADFTLNYNMTSAFASVNSNAAAYFGGNMRVIYTHGGVPSYNAAPLWVWQGTNVAYGTGETLNPAAIPTSNTAWTLTNNVALKAMVNPVTPVNLTTRFQSTNGNIMTFTKALSVAQSVVTVTATSITTNSLGQSCLNIDFTTKCASIRKGTQLDFFAPTIPGSSPAKHIFSNIADDCADNVNFAPNLRGQYCSNHSGGMVIKNAYTSARTTTSHSVQICGIIVPPAGTTYNFTMYFRTADNELNVRYATAAVSVVVPSAPAVAAAAKSGLVAPLTLVGTVLNAEPEDADAGKRGLQSVISGASVQLALLVVSAAVAALLNSYVSSAPASKNIAALTMLTYCQLSNSLLVLSPLLSGSSLAESIAHNPVRLIAMLLTSAVAAVSMLALAHALRQADAKSNSLVALALTTVFGASPALSALASTQRKTAELVKGIRAMLAALTIVQVGSLCALIVNVGSSISGGEVVNVLGTLLSLAALAVAYQATDNESLVVKSGVQLGAGSESDRLSVVSMESR